MIKKITLAQRKGLYQTATRFPKEIKFPQVNEIEFSQVNLIFGWNYSGKTTLARIFQDIADGKIETQEDLSSYQGKIKVFNADYVAKNIKPEQLNGFVTIGETNIELEQKIAQLNQELGTQPDEANQGSGLYLQQSEAQNQIKLVEQQKNNYTIDSIAKDHIHDDIVKGLEISKQKYNKNKFNDSFIARYSNYKKTNELHILDEINLGETLKKATEDTNLIQPIDELKVTKLLFIGNELVQNIIQCLQESPNILERIENLPQSADYWVHQGMDLHKEAKQCYYCGNNITAERREQLNQHFLQDAQKELQDKLEGLTNPLQEIVLEKYPNKDDLKCLDADTKNTYEQTCQNLNTVIKEYNQVIAELKQQIDNKINNPFQLMEYQLSKGFSLEEKQNIANIYLVDIQQSIREHNESIAKQEKIKEQAIQSYKNHHIDNHLENYHKQVIEYESETNKLDKQLKEFTTKQDNINNTISNKESKKNELQKQQSSYEKTRENLLQNINALKVSPNLTLAMAEHEEKKVFQVQREPNLNAAENLSEGEKTVIAISFFLAELQALKANNQLKDTIVFIDDPISSFDSNHLYSCCKQIANFFDNKDSFKQLFLTTHNWEFYTQIKQYNMPKGGHQFFIIEDKQLMELPEDLKKFSSEYQLIFNKVHRYYSSSNESKQNIPIEEIIIISNLMRRLAETFLSFYTTPAKYQETLKQWKKQFPILDSDSHALDTKNLTNPEQVKDAVQFLMKQIKNLAEGHFDAMTIKEEVQDK